MSSVDICFVGGGPVALWTAVQAKIHDPRLNIVIMEQRTEYARDHVLKLNSESFLGAPVDKRINNLIKEFRINRMLPFFSSSYIRTKEIEEKLKRLVTDLGVQFVNEKIEDPVSLKERYPNVKVIVGSDGAHSIVRKQVFHNELQTKESYKYICEVKYTAIGKAQQMNDLKIKLNSSRNDLLITDHVGKPGKDGNTPVTLRFFIDKIAYQKMYQLREGATAKHPWKLDEPQLPKKIKKNIENMVKARQKEQGEDADLNSIKISALELGAYASKRFVIREKDKPTWCLVGDAALGVPFFRSLNNGFKSGTVLARTLANLDKHYLFSYYENYQQRLTFQEITIAKVKSYAISFLEGIIHCFNRGIIPIDRWTNTIKDFEWV